MDRPGHACVYRGIIYASAVGIRAEQCTLRFAESFVSFAENFVNLAEKSGILTFIVTLAVFMASYHFFSCAKILSIDILESYGSIAVIWVD